MCYATRRKRTLLVRLLRTSRLLLVQQREEERGGLPCSGLCAGDQVLAVERDWDCSFLYRSGCRIARVSHCADECWMQAQFVKRHLCWYSNPMLTRRGAICIESSPLGERC